MSGRSSVKFSVILITPSCHLSASFLILEELPHKINNMDHDLEGDKLEGFIEATERILDFIDKMEE